MDENKRQYIEVIIRSGLDTTVGYMEVSYFINAETFKKVVRLVTPKLYKPRGKKKPTASDLRLKELRDIAEGKK